MAKKNQLTTAVVEKLLEGVHFVGPIVCDRCEKTFKLDGTLLRINVDCPVCGLPTRILAPREKTGERVVSPSLVQGNATKVLVDHVSAVAGVLGAGQGDSLIYYNSKDTSNWKPRAKKARQRKGK